MSKKKEYLNLPKRYEIKKDTPKKFHKFKNRQKLSYSQYTSYKDPKYNLGYILGYIFGIEQPSNFWATFGSYCGDTLAVRLNIKNAKDEKEKKVIEDAFNYFNEKDLETLKGVDKLFPKDAVYEREVVLDLGDFVLQGFIDVNYKKEGKEIIIDNKTGGKNSNDKGTAYYGSSKYGQVNLYKKALEQESCKVGYCGVVFMDRTFEGTFEEPILHLSGEVIHVQSPYVEEDMEILIEDIKRVAKEISSLNTTYNVLKNLTFQL